MKNLPRTVVQCKTCPWRVDCVPDEDIPYYKVELHKGLACSTIASGLESLRPGLKAMACHYSKRGTEIACAGWLHNQIGEGHNIGVRIAVSVGRLPVPRVDGEQHATFEDTLPEDA